MKRINKKGFTLIELLAVIVVLAIIMLLAVQTVLPQMEKARRNAFAVEVNGFVEAAQNYAMQKYLDGKTCSVVGMTDVINEGLYEVKNSTDYKGTVTIASDSANPNKKTYTVTMTNGSFYVSGFTGKLNGEDKEGDNYVIQGGTGNNITSTSTCS